jgi:hypothetical protein
MKILILTGHFYPELHPRSFRANELACEMSRIGHRVEVGTLRTINSFNYENYEKVNKIKINKLDLYTQSNNFVVKDSSTGKLFKKFNNLFRFLLDYFIGGMLFINAYKIKKKILLDDYDLVISLSTPFMNLLAISLIKKKSNSKTILVADSGDPFFRSQQTKRAPYFYFLEKYVYDKFDYLTIPDIAVKVAYDGLISIEKIKIIPQGFRMDNVKLGIVPMTEVVSFAYCGVFYLDIRNPTFLLDKLTELDASFRFDIYLREKNSIVTNVLEKYKLLLGSKLNIIYGIERNELLYRLSSVNFLVNIENLTTTQIPSKLIDYAITGRPIFSCSSVNFSEIKLQRFFDKDYSEALVLDKERYNIKHIANQFLSLHPNKNNNE